MPKKYFQSKKPRVVVAMSGGVDSSVAALLLKKQGYDVIGIFLKLWTPLEYGNCQGIVGEPLCGLPNSGGHAGPPLQTQKKQSIKQNLCCDDKAMLVARQIADKLEIPFYVIKVDNLFKKEIVDNFISEYEKGLTPNPCVRCNRYIKFGYLWEKAQGLGADYLATGHYVRQRRKIRNQKFEILNKYEIPKFQINKLKAKKTNRLNNSNLEFVSDLDFKVSNFFISRSKDAAKDQTYFLSTIDPDVIPHLLFPLGNMEKSEVREIARKNKLPVYNKKDSAGICFIPDGDNDAFLSAYSKKKKKPGQIVDKYGNVLGQHEGLMGYTVGEKLGDDRVASSWHLVARKEKTNPQLPTTNYSANIPRLYVTKIDPQKNQLVIGENEDCFSSEMTVEDFNVVNPDFWKYIDGKKTVLAQIRGGHKPEKSKIFLVNPKSQIPNPKQIRNLKSKNIKLRIIFLHPVRAITPGQTAAIYTLKGELLGGGVIGS